jgi:hypothetical protein
MGSFEENWEFGEGLSPALSTVTEWEGAVKGQVDCRKGIFVHFLARIVEKVLVILPYWGYNQLRITVIFYV